MNAPQPTQFTPEGPQPLVREIPAGAAYPVEALGPLCPAVEAVQGMTQAPVALPAASALAVASLAVQGFADVETLGGFAVRYQVFFGQRFMDKQNHITMIVDYWSGHFGNPFYCNLTKTIVWCR